MEMLYRTAAPAYRGCHPPPQQRSGFLAGLWCYLFGSGSAPVYRTPHGKNGSAVPAVTRCWWQAFPSTPAYKPAPARAPDEPAPDVPTVPTDGADDAGCEWREPDDVIPEDDPSAVYIVTG